MKISTLISTMSLFLFAYITKAQSPLKFKYQSTPAYSVNNYKQLDKAALVKKYKLDGLKSLIYVEISLTEDLAKRNYKAQAVPIKASRALVVSTTAHKGLCLSVGAATDEE